METWQLDLVGVEVRRKQRTGLVVLQEPGLQKCGRRLLRGERLFLRKQGDTKTEHEHFVSRVKGTRVWLCCWTALRPW